MAAGGGAWKGGSFSPAVGRYAGAPAFGKEEKTVSRYGATKGQVMNRTIPVTRVTSAGYRGEVATLEWSSIGNRWDVVSLGGRLLGSSANLRTAKKIAQKKAKSIRSEGDL